MFPNNTNNNNGGNSNGNSFTSKSFQLYNRFKGYNDDGSLKSPGRYGYYRDDINSSGARSYFGFTSGTNDLYNSTYGGLSSIHYPKWLVMVGHYYRQLTSHTRLVTIVQVVVLFYLLLHTMNKFQRTDDSDATLNQYRNNLCDLNGDLNNNNNYYMDAFSDSSFRLEFPNINRATLCRSSSGSLVPEAYNGDKKSFKKFIWIFVDSFAHDQASEIVDNYAGHSHQYRILNHGFKFSTAIYTTFFTGKIPTNYAGKPIRSDNIFYQFKKSGMKIHFVGPEFPTIALLGDSSQSRRYFESYTNHIDDHKLFTPVFGNQLTTPTVTSVSEALDKLTRSGQHSVMMTTNLLDDKIHKKGKYDPPTLSLIQQLTANMPLLKEWLSQHPDYVFIMNSDHGGSKTGGQHEGELHGIKDGGNEGFIFFHNPQFPQQTLERPWLDTVDISPTITEYFKDINIPLESLGLVPSENYKVDSHANKTALYMDLLINALQIRQLCKLKRFPYSESIFQSATEYGTDSMHQMSSTLLNQKIEELRNFIISIKDPMIEFKKFPGRYLLFMLILVLIVQYLNLKIDYQQGNLFTLSNLKKNFFSIGIPYLFLYIDFLFLKFDYHKHFQNIFTYYLILVSITLLNILHNLFNNLSLPQKTLVNSNNSNNVNSNNTISNSNNNNNSNMNNSNGNGKVENDQKTSPSTSSVKLISLNNNNQGMDESSSIIDIPLNEISENDITDSHSRHSSQSQQINENEHELEYYQSVTPQNEWIVQTSNIVSLIIMITCLKDLIIEFLPMIYEGLKSFNFIINYLLIIYQLRFLFNGSSTSSNSGSSSNGNSNSISSRIFQEVNNSGGVYLVIVLMTLFYDLTGSVVIMQFAYLCLLVKTIQIILMVQTTDEIYMVASILLYILSTDNQRFFLLVFYLAPMYFLSGIYSERPKLSLQVPTFANSLRYLSRMIAFLMIILAFHSYIYMGGEFNMNVDVRSGGIGLVNMEDYPTFSGFLMAFHKLGYFFVLITFLHRLSKPSLQDDKDSYQLNMVFNAFNQRSQQVLSIQQTQQLYELRYQLFRFLAQKSLIMMMIFNFNFWQYKDYLDCFIMTLIISIIAVGFGFLFVIDIICRKIQPQINYYLAKIKFKIMR
ncbi:hypothetical protein DLAC_02161 [Tieghemostelium lacteum]|uniref:Uncharacterized protein n=1 Tax=Tieghemostelium lacteum TaxID=361077 RepID=A0A152A4Q3_TIELA|nr:hypothetical protein DLAC_02161 [Tieghemostelium lacteum]|eukprot:KYR01067.1 hypothetical protein DLAC_02161 [Tieghemostelium lacteum]